MKSKIIITSIALISVMLIACEKNTPAEKPAINKPATESTKASPHVQEIENFLSKDQAKVEAADPGNKNPFSNILSGELVETFDASSFTYVKIKTANGFAWAAGPTTALKKGDTVSFNGKTPMENFHSKSLNKTFEMIYFVNNFNVNGVSAKGSFKEHNM